MFLDAFLLRSLVCNTGKKKERLVFNIPVNLMGDMDLPKNTQPVEEITTYNTHINILCGYAHIATDS